MPRSQISVHYGGEFLMNGMGCNKRKVDSLLIGTVSPRLDDQVISCGRIASIPWACGPKCL